MHKLHYQQKIMDLAKKDGSVDLSRVSRVETMIRRRGRRSGWMGDKDVMVLDVLENRSPKTMASLDAAEEVSDDNLARKLEGLAAFEKPGGWGTRFQQGDYLKVVRRAYVLLERLGIVRAAQGRGRWTRERVEAAARMVGEYHVWRWMPRSLRGADHPRNLESFAVGYGLQASEVSQTLYLARYPRWSKRYVPGATKEQNLAEIKDILMDAVRKQEAVNPEKVNANLFKVALEANGESMGAPGFNVTVNQNTLNVGAQMSQEEYQARRARLEQYAANYLVGGSDVEERTAVEVPRRAGAEHGRTDQAPDADGDQRAGQDPGVP